MPTLQPDLSHRLPRPPAPIECFDLPHTAIPKGRVGFGGLEGLTILHISDLHVRRNLVNTDRYRTILHALAQTPADIIALTGDLMDDPGQEQAAIETLTAMSEHWRPRIGAFAVLGNHDTPDLARRMQEVPNLNTLGITSPATLDLPIGGCMLRLMGLNWPEDPLRVTLDAPPLPADQPSLTLALAHHPTALIAAADFSLPILLAGHTHAGQIRLHARLAPHTSSDLPPHLAGGMLRLRDTLCCISRGLGDGVVEGLRINCPRQMPLYTLRHGELPSRGLTSVVTQVVAW